jgi:hypothetical protein
MTMNCRGFLNGWGTLFGDERWCDGREHRERKCDKARRCSRLVRPLGDRRRDMLQLHPAAESRSPRAPDPRPACAGRSPRAALAENTAQGLCQVSTFYTTLVKKSQQANGASELRRIPLPRTRVNRLRRAPTAGVGCRLALFWWHCSHCHDHLRFAKTGQNMHRQPLAFPQPRENPLGERSRWVMTKRLLRTTLEESKGIQRRCCLRVRETKFIANSSAAARLLCAGLGERRK